jgi:K+-sensing histidine kinase KdpD
MLESGRRNADRFQGEFHVLHFANETQDAQNGGILDRNLEYAHELGAEVHTLTDTDVVSAILDFAVRCGITQIFVGRTSSKPDFWARLRGNLAVRLIRAAEGMDVVVYP